MQHHKRAIYQKTMRTTSWSRIY